MVVVVGGRSQGWVGVRWVLGGVCFEATAKILQRRHISGLSENNFRQHSTYLPGIVVSHIQRIGCQPEKNYFTRSVSNPARGLLNREKRTK